MSEDLGRILLSVAGADAPVKSKLTNIPLRVIIGSPTFMVLSKSAPSRRWRRCGTSISVHAIAAAHQSMKTQNTQITH